MPSVAFAVRGVVHRSVRTSIELSLGSGQPSLQASIASWTHRTFRLRVAVTPHCSLGSIGSHRDHGPACHTPRLPTAVDSISSWTGATSSLQTKPHRVSTPPHLMLRNRFLTHASPTRPKSFQPPHCPVIHTPVDGCRACRVSYDTGRSPGSHRHSGCSRPHSTARRRCLRSRKGCTTQGSAIRQCS